MRTGLQNRAFEFRLFWACMLPLLLKPSPVVQALAIKWLGWLPKLCHQRTATGFTLAELLICIAILGVIATFTVPKLMVAQQNQQYNAAAKEAIAAMSSAYQSALTAGTVTSNTKPLDLLPYLNYVALDTSSLIDHQINATTPPTLTCSNAEPCVRMHDGAVIFLAQYTFSGTASTNAIYYFIDPDGKVTDGTTNGPGKSMAIFIYYNGRVTSRDIIDNNTTSSNGSRGPCALCLSPWFSW